MESFEGCVALEGETVGLVKKGLSFRVARILLGYLETYRLDLFLLTIGGMLEEG